MASTEMPPPPTSLAVPLYNSDSGSSAAAATAVPLVSKKKEHLAAGRRKLEEYRKRKAEEKKSGERIRTDGPISEKSVSAPPEERILDKSDSSSVHVNKSVFVNGPESNIISESAVKARPLADRLSEIQLDKEESNGKSSRRVESYDFLIEGAGSNTEETVNSVKVSVSESLKLSDNSVSRLIPTSFSFPEGTDYEISTNDSTYRFPDTDKIFSETAPLDRVDGLDRVPGPLNGQENSVWRQSSYDWPAAHGSKDDFSSDNTGYRANQEDDVTGVESDGSIFNEEGGNHKKKPFGDSSGLSSTKSPYNSSTVFPIQKKQSAVTSMGMPALSFMPSQREVGTDSLNSSRENIGSYANANDTPVAIESATDERSSFVPSRTLEGTKPNFSFRPSDNLSSGKILPTTSLALPMHQSSADATLITYSTATGTSVKQVMSDMLSAAMSEGLSVTGHGMGFPNRSEEIQRHSERDEFALLEQHIEDLTQEKFSLQRALDTARSLAESLAQENSALTEDYNTQGIAINQLQADLDRQADEIKAQSLVLSSLMLEREKAQQESNSALERSQILAGEVIKLEEKALKLRSNELRLAKDLEVVKSENDSCRGQLTTLEKDRQNLRSMVEALQEEKKLMQGHFRKSLGSRDPQMSDTKGVQSKEFRNASTSTADLGKHIEGWEATMCIEQKEQLRLKGMEGSNELSETSDTRFEASSSANSTVAHIQVDLNASPAVAMLPVDHYRMVNNIDLLITELAAQKESFLKELKRESKKASELKALNAELSKKLEVQTQRLELVYAQNMAHGGTTMITTSNDLHQENEFVDEGDEVVDRVLGWIMRLFPSGSSKRRTSKLL